MLYKSNINNMTIKEYQRIKIILVILLSLVFSQSIIYQNFILAMLVMIAITMLIVSMKKKVKEAIHDERDWDIGGKAALRAMQVYSWTGVVAMLALKSLAKPDNDYDIIAHTIAFSICIFMLLYGFIFRYMSKGKIFDGYVIFSLIVLLFFIIMGILGVISL